MPVWVVITVAPVYMCERGGGNGERAGEGGDAKEVASSLEPMSLGTHRREVVDAHGKDCPHP